MLAVNALPVYLRPGQVGRRRTNFIASRFAVLLVFFLAATSALAEGAMGDLVVHASGFADDRGQAIANIFRAEDDVFRKPYRRVTASIKNGVAILSFPQLPYAGYAVTLFHDRNGNGDLDHNFMHMPAEPLGFSNGFKMSLFSGLPSYAKLRFEFSPDSKPLEIVVR